MVESFKLWCEPAGENRIVNVYLPNDYHESEDRYPVVYMFDGHNIFYDEEAAYGKSRGIREFLDRWDKKVIVVVNTSNPFVLSEIEPYADAILITFTIQTQAILDIINGTYEPSGLLPFQMPLNMKTVEEQAEDTPRDMECYKDADGNVYDFAYGLNWSGVINDERVKKYK